MYGMIHLAIRQMLTDKFGEAEWNKLEREIGIGPADQISLNVYEDSLTLRILEAVAQRLGQNLPDCLQSFGRFWVRFAERGSYGSIMNFTGSDLAGFIANLDRMHQAVVAAMPQSKVPSFSVSEQSSGRLRVEYRSERSGLGPFVIGLLQGLLDRFGLDGEVSQVDSRSNALEFIVTYHPAA